MNSNKTPISTRDFIFKPADYFKILIGLRVRKYGLGFLVLLLLIVFYTGFTRNWLIGVSLTFVLIAIAIFLYYKIKMTVYGPLSRRNLVVQKLEFHTNKLIQSSTKGSAEIQYSDIAKINFNESHWLLFLNKEEFIYIPKDAFTSEEDRIEVEEMLSDV